VSDVVLIPLPGVGTLELPREVYEQHLVRPAEATPQLQSAAEILDADQLEARTGVPASWWMTQARERRIPFHKFGRYVRFNLAEVSACDAYRRRVVDVAGHRVQNGGASG
jgi:hypothetical protein